jgi:tRNA threonylcarbamoyladenosine biosynthesis protein TsaB
MSVKILAIDTSTENCSVTLVNGEQQATRRDVAPRDHAQKILPMVDAVLKETGLTMTDLDALAFGRGPGSFTGVRICIGMAQGLAFGAGLPMIPVSTLEAMAQGCYRLHGETHIACAIDARMGEIYWGRYVRQNDGCWMCVDAESVIDPQQLIKQTPSSSAKWRSAGTGWQTYAQVLTQLPMRILPGVVLYPDAEDIASLAVLAFERGLTVAPEAATPVYLRDQVAWKKMPGRE